MATSPEEAAEAEKLALASGLQHFATWRAGTWRVLNDEDDYHLTEQPHPDRDWLLPLALMALDAPDAIEVLEDACEERDFRLHEERFGRLAHRPLKARAIAAVLLFGEWDWGPMPWAVAAASVVLDDFSNWGGLDLAGGATLDWLATELFELFGLRRGAVETDVEFRERCRVASGVSITGGGALGDISVAVQNVARSCIGLDHVDFRVEPIRFGRVLVRIIGLETGPEDDVFKSHLEQRIRREVDPVCPYHVSLEIQFEDRVRVPLTR